jgi:dethiobiotin synthetase
MKPLFITGIGTGIGKTMVSAIVTEALQADYWKPVQAGDEGGTDSEWIENIISNPRSKIFPEAYKLSMAASPHLAARAQGETIRLNTIAEAFNLLATSGNNIVIEGAGGLMAPLNEEEFVIDLIKLLNAKVILVSKNYLGSINHSLLTANACKAHGVNVAGWIFNDEYLNYEEDIARWSGFPVIASIPWSKSVNKDFILQQAVRISPALNNLV